MAAKKPLVLDTSANLQQMQSGDFIDIAQGGTGATTQAGALTNLGAYPASNPNNYISALQAPVQSVAGRTGVVSLSQADIAGLTVSSSPTFNAVTASTFTGTLSGTASGITGGTTGAIPYQISANNTSFLPLGTNGYILQAGPSSPNWISVQSLALSSGQVLTALGFTPVNAANVGVANGLATLGSDGKLTAAQIPSTLLGAVQYQGVWNAATNVPALTSGTGSKGQYYKVSVSGTTTVDGISQWNAGDMIIFDGTVWDKIDGISSEVTSVAGRTGNVLLSQADIVGLTASSSPTFASVTANTFTGSLTGTSTGLAGGSIGAVVYQSAVGVTSFLAPGTAGYVLTSQGPGNAPTWTNIVATSPVQSVAGRTGIVTLSQADITGLTTTSSPTFAAVTATTFTGNLSGNASSASATVSTLTNDSPSNIVIGNAVYIDAANGVKLAKADQDITSQVIGLANGTITVGNSGLITTGNELVATIAQWQSVGASSSGLTPGADYFLSNVTAGAITSTPPTTGYVIKVGKALSTTRMLVKIGPRIQL